MCTELSASVMMVAPQVTVGPGSVASDSSLEELWGISRPRCLAAGLPPPPRPATGSEVQRDPSSPAHAPPPTPAQPRPPRSACHLIHCRPAISSIAALPSHPRWPNSAGNPRPIRSHPSRPLLCGASSPLFGAARSGAATQCGHMMLATLPSTCPRAQTEQMCSCLVRHHDRHQCSCRSSCSPSPGQSPPPPPTDLPRASALGSLCIRNSDNVLGSDQALRLRSAAEADRLALYSTGGLGTSPPQGFRGCSRRAPPLVCLMSLCCADARPSCFACPSLVLEVLVLLIWSWSSSTAPTFYFPSRSFALACLSNSQQPSLIEACRAASAGLKAARTRLRCTHCCAMLSGRCGRCCGR